MSKIPNNLHHTRETYLYSVAFAFERSAYYGIRGLIVLYMINELQFNDTKAFSIHGLITSGGFLAMIIGGLLGDLITGNRKSLILGATLQFIGALTLCFNSIFSLYTALGLFIIGSGFYSSNIKSLFGKLYLNKINLADSGFTILYIAVNIGAFLGTTIVVEVGHVNYTFGFILAGLLLALSAALCYYIKENLFLVDQIKDQISALRFKPRLIYLLSTIAIFTIFGILYEVSSQIWLDFQSILRDMIDTPFIMLIGALPSIINFIFAVILCILWKNQYLDHFIKISIGFVFVGFTFLLMPLYPSNLVPNNIGLILVCMLFLNLGELIILPSIYSAITKYTNPKYLATMFGVLSIPSFLISGISNGLFYIDDNSSMKVIIGSTVSLITIVLLMIFRRKYKNNYLQHGI